MRRKLALAFVLSLLSLNSIELTAFGEEIEKVETINSDIEFNGSSITYKGEEIKLGKRCIYVNSSLGEDADKYDFVYSDIKEALSKTALTDGTQLQPMKIYLEPNVYWIDNPDATDTLEKKEGYDLPYGMVVECENLNIIGLCDNPSDVVIAGNRGQSHGANGNYTMFHFVGDGLKMENVTIGNYCSIDLVYEKDTTKNKEKRAEAITQAQLATLDGDKFFAQNCSFIGRLNLVPVSGGERSLYKNCHFEMTDDSLNGNAVYLDCDFDFYGNRPIYNTFKTGSVFLNCLFNSKINSMDFEPNQYFTKEGGPVTAIDCKYITNEEIGFRWTKYPNAELRCYDYNNSADGKNTVIDKNSKTTVSLDGTKALNAYKFKYRGEEYYNIYNLLKGDDDWDILNMKNAVKGAEIKDNENYSAVATYLEIKSDLEEIESEKDEANITGSAYYFYNKPSEDKIKWSISEADSEYAQLIENENGSCVLKGINNSEEHKNITVYAQTDSGLKGAVCVNVKPIVLPSPKFTKKPEILKNNDTLVLNYSLELGDREDKSIISWYRCSDQNGNEPILTAVSRFDEPLSAYKLSEGDEGYFIMAKIEPKHIRSNAGEPIYVIFENKINKSDILSENSINTDFKNFPTSIQSEIKEGFWTVDQYKPSDVEKISVSDTETEPWAYGETGNGSIGSGLYQNVQGARLMYTPMEKIYSDMELNINLDPAKTAGQGFGSAGQYMDLCVKFDTKTLTGYGLRILRSPEASNGVVFVLVKYENGSITEISERVMSSCYLTDCNINLKTENGKIYAAAQTSSPQPEDRKEAGYSHNVSLSAEINDNNFGGFMLQHTGTTGTGGWQNTTMLHNLNISYK